MKAAVKKAFTWGLSLFTGNPVVVSGISLTIVVGTSTTLKRALIVALIQLYLCLLSSTLAVAIRVRIQKEWRTVVFCVAAALFYIPVGYLLPIYYLQVYDALGIYLPLLTISSIVIAYSSEISGSKNMLGGLQRSMKSALGFGVTICVAGAIRELLAFGTVFELPVSSIKIPGVASIYSGFIVVGMLIALAKVISKKIGRAK